MKITQDVHDYAARQREIKVGTKGIRRVLGERRGRLMVVTVASR